MTFTIATSAEPQYGSISGPTDGVIDYSTRPEHAERKHRQIIAAVEACETPEEVQNILHQHDEILDNLFLNFPDYAEAIKEAATDHIANLQHGAASAGAPAPIPATAQSNVLNKAF